jgi:hypothetical protein
MSILAGLSGALILKGNQHALVTRKFNARFGWDMIELLVSCLDISVFLLSHYPFVLLCGAFGSRAL